MPLSPEPKGASATGRPDDTPPAPGSTDLPPRPSRGPITSAAPAAAAAAAATSLEVAIRTIREEVSAANARAARFEAEVVASRARAQALERERDRLRAERDTLAPAAAGGGLEKKALEERIVALARERGDMEETARRILHERTQLEAEVERFKKDLAKGAEKAVQRILELEAAMEGLNNERKELEGKVEEMEGAAVEAQEAAQAEIDEALTARDEELRELLAMSLTRKGVEKLLERTAEGSVLEELLQDLLENAELPKAGVFGGAFFQ